MNIPITQISNEITVIEHNGSKWLTAEQLGLALGFSQNNARDGINRLYRRHVDEFSTEDSVTVKLTATDGKQYEMRIFSHSGCNLISFFANTPNAKAFRAWAKIKLAEPQSISPDLLERYKIAYLQAAPQEARLIEYYQKGLSLSDMAKLLDLAAGSVSHRLKKLTALGLINYCPNPVLSERGKLGRIKMLEKRATIQQSLELGE